MMTQEDTMGDQEVSMEEDEKVAFWPNLRRMLRLLKLCWPMLLSLVVVKMLSRWSGLMENVVRGGIVDAFVAMDRDNFVAEASQLSFWYLVLVLSDTAEGILTQRIAIFLSRTVRLQLYTSLMTDKSQAFFDESKSGALASRLSSDCRTIAYDLNTWLPTLLTLILDIAYGLSYMAYTDWGLSIIVLIFLPIVAFSSWLQARWESPLQEQYYDMVDEANARATEALLHSKTVRIFGQQRREIELYRRLLHGLDGISWKLALASGLSVGFITLSYRFCLLATFWYGGTLVLRGDLTEGQFLAFCMFALSLSGSINEIPYLNTRLVCTLASLNRVYSIIDNESVVDLKLAKLGEPRTPSDNGVVPPADRVVKGHIEFKNVAFAYPSRSEVPVLQDFNLSVAAGASAALVGSSGGGKSTIVSLIVKLYQLSGGQITLDGVDIATLNTNWLRKQVGFVSQEPVLFSGTIRDNICYGLASDGFGLLEGTSPKEGIPTVSQERVEEVARMANAHDFISSLPLGYDTLVGEHGSLLSAGQRQRIAIARAMLRDPKILIADEATSALDNASERLVQQALDRLMVGRTCIVIAHRLSTIRQCDPICYIGKGKIMEQGSHAALLALPAGHYAKLHAFEAEGEPLTSSQEQIFDGGSNQTITDDPNKEESEAPHVDALLASDHTSKPRKPMKS